VLRTGGGWEKYMKLLSIFLPADLTAKFWQDAERADDNQLSAGMFPKCHQSDGSL